MYEADHVVSILRCGRELQKEIAKTFNPDRNAITALCQQIENSAHKIYQWANGIEDENGQT